LPLAPGRYNFTLHFAINGVVADAIENAGTFDVEPGDFFRTGKLPSGQGQFFVDHSFSVS
jgi:lipopolysaccharide transport system ATP-binding protein